MVTHVSFCLVQSERSGRCNERTNPRIFLFQCSSHQPPPQSPLTSGPRGPSGCVSPHQPLPTLRVVLCGVVLSAALFLLHHWGLRSVCQPYPSKKVDAPESEGPYCIMWVLLFCLASRPAFVTAKGTPRSRVLRDVHRFLALFLVSAHKPI